LGRAWERLRGRGWSVMVVWLGAVVFDLGELGRGS
jgi:hypothetical protein